MILPWPLGGRALARPHQVVAAAATRSSSAARGSPSTARRICAGGPSGGSSHDGPAGVGPVGRQPPRPGALRGARAEPTSPAPLRTSSGLGARRGAVRPRWRHQRRSPLAADLVHAGRPWASTTSWSAGFEVAGQGARASRAADCPDHEPLTVVMAGTSARDARSYQGRIFPPSNVRIDMKRFLALSHPAALALVAAGCGSRRQQQAFGTFRINLVPSYDRQPSYPSSSHGAPGKSGTVAHRHQGLPPLATRRTSRSRRARRGHLDQQRQHRPQRRGPLGAFF